MKTTICALGASAVLFVSVHAWAGAQDQQFDFDCDVPAGSYSQWTGSLSPRADKVSGQIELVESRLSRRRTSKSWGAVANVYLVRGDQAVGVRMIPDFDDRDVIKVTTFRPAVDGGAELIGTVSRKNGPVAFSMTWTPAGGVELQVAGKTVSLSAGNFAPESLAVSCSTGEFKFTDMTVETADGP